jgi:LacI family transcriptional regulator, galactose operon repressor
LESKRVAVVMRPARPYCRGVLRGVASVSAQARWECILISADGPPPVVDLAGFVHGLIGHFSEKVLLEHVDRARVPAVDISPAQRHPSLPRVSTDDVAVGRLAAAHLLSLGLPHLGFFGSRTDYDSQQREHGFRQAMGAAGPTCHVFLNGASRDVSGAAHDDNGRHGSLEHWVRQLPKPIGILASTDTAALDLLAVCRKLEVDVPGSVAVLGVGNDDVLCDLANPALSSIALSTQRIGYEAARMLDRLMAGESPAQEQLLVSPAGVVPRRSSDVPSILDPDVAAAVRYISLHVQDDLQVADLLREVPMSRRSLEQRFHKALGRTPAAEIHRAQIEVARQMLTQTDEPLARVALAAGFSDAKQLGASFHRETGSTPTAYRRDSRKP